MSFKNILVFRIGHLGDTLVALPAFWELRRAFPEAKMTLLSNVDARNPNYLAPKDVLPTNGLFDRFVDYPTNLGRVASAFAAAKLLLETRFERYDALYYLMPRARSAHQIARDRRFFKAAGLSELRGGAYLADNCLSGPIPQPAPVMTSEAQFLLDLLEREGIRSQSETSTDLLITPMEVDGAQRWLTNRGVRGDSKYIGVAPGSKWESKIWSEKKFEHVVNSLIEAKNVIPIVFGGKEDLQKGDRLVSSWGKGANAAGALSVRESAALLRDCSLYLGNDTGTMHLAAAVGVPCVSLFAAIDYPGRWTPYGDRNITFRIPIECEGCHTPNCFNAHKCLELIDVHEVTQACISVLDNACGS